MLTLERVNNALKTLNKRVKVKECLGQKGNVYFFRLDNGKHLIVFYNRIYGENIITHILIQQRAHQPYTYLLNGQPGKNTELIYVYGYEEDTL